MAKFWLFIANIIGILILVLLLIWIAEGMNLSLISSLR